MFKWIVKNIYGANLFGKLLIGHLISTLYTTLEPKKKKSKEFDGNSVERDSVKWEISWDYIKKKFAFPVGKQA